MTASLIAIFFLLLLSAFFSGSETALTAASRPLMHQLERNGNRRARLINRMDEKRGRLIGAILLGNNLVNILASALATSTLITLFGEAGIAYATIAMTLLVLIFSEILPKTYAFRNASRAALAVAPIINILVAVLSPITRAINVVVRGILKLFGSDDSVDTTIDTAAEELRGAIELHAAPGHKIHHERAMLRSVLDLAEVQVGEIMIHRKSVATIEADLPAAEVLSQVLDSPYTRIPLWQGKADNIVGVLHVKALLRAVQAKGQEKIDGKSGTIDDLDIISLAAPPWFIPESTPLLVQIQAFRKRREHFALVIDEYGSLMGIVTLEDILEEIVGDISDELDVPVSGVSREPNGSYIVEGNVTIRDLNRQFEWRLPDEEASTIAGLILHESRRIPEIGQEFLFHEFHFEILQRQRHQITSVRIIPPEDQRAKPSAGE